MRETYELSIPLLGIHQLENAATAVATLEALDNLGIQIPALAITTGLRQVNWPGRLQILEHSPLVVVDGAHNAYSMKKLVEAVRTLFSYKECHVVFGTSCDKDICGMVRELKPIAHNVIVTSSTHPRAAPVSTINNEFRKNDINTTTVTSVPEALSHLLSYAQKNDLILITGSLFIVAEAISFFITLAHAEDSSAK
jgi:dihydrofolate synthase/folylpolyglutamate synthase